MGVLLAMAVQEGPMEVARVLLIPIPPYPQSESCGTLRGHPVSVLGKEALTKWGFLIKTNITWKKKKRLCALMFDIILGILVENDCILIQYKFP